LVVHHFKKSGKNGSSRGGQKLRGSSSLHGWSENSLYLMPSRSDTIHVEIESKDAEEMDFHIKMEEEDFKIRFKTCDKPDRGASETKKKIIEAYRDKTGNKELWASTSELAKEINVYRTTVQNHVKNMAMEGDGGVEVDDRTPEWPPGKARNALCMRIANE